MAEADVVTAGAEVNEDDASSVRPVVEVLMARLLVEL